MKDRTMKRPLFALTATALLVTGFASSAMAQERYYRDNAPAVYLEQDEPEGYYIQNRDRYDRDRRDWRDHRRERFGPRDVARMLERRGYRVRNVDFERGRYFARASRRGNPVIVVVSRRGEILETRRLDRERRSGFRIEINPAY
jgi:hypothetical protein